MSLCACGGGDDSDSTVAGSSDGPASTTSASGEGPDDTMSAGPGDTVAGSSGVEPSTSATTGVGPVTDDGGVTTGGSVDACTGAAPKCPDGQTCRASACCDGAGFCISAESPSCGGFVGEPCPDALVCVTDSCVADGQGRCLDPATAAALEALQPGCWNAG